MPKASPAEYKVATDGSYVLYKTSGVPVKYKKHQHRGLSSERSIRLLRRIRSHRDDNSFDHFSIEERSLDDPSLEYDAVSYVWGDPAATAPLILGNEADGTVRLITKTAWQAIETLCMFGRLLWIDQICINQEDDTEKQVQIGLMGEIYSSQKRFVTIVWLGAADEETVTAFDLVNKLSETFPLEMDMPINANDAFHMPHDMIRKKIQARYPDYKPPADHDPSWASLAKIFARTWYSRMWTFQEVVLTSLDSVSVVCAGRTSLCTTSLRRVIRASILLGAYPIPGYSDAVMENRASLRIIDMIQQRLLMEQPTPLHYLLQVTAGRDCKDPKDKIYALLNVQRNDLDMEKITVNLKKSPTELYTEATRKIIRSESSLLISLSASGRHEGKVPKLPSWVPDYSGIISAPYLEAPDPNSPVFSAGGGRRWRDPSNHARSPSSAQQLLVQGRRIDFIIKTDDHVMPPKAGGDDTYAYLCQILPMILSEFMKSPGVHDTNKAMLHIAKTVIVGGYNTYLFGLRSFSFMLGATHASYGGSAKLQNAMKCENEDLAMLRHIFSGPSPSATLGHVDEDERQWNHDFVKQAALCKGRRFAFLKHYGVGLVPQQTEVGDIVTILHGSSLPVVLRRAQGSDLFHLVGPCFVAGVMLGEAINWPEDKADMFVLV